MKIGYGLPGNASWSLTGSGAAFVTDDSGLDDGWPQRRTRISFTDTDPQTIAEVVGLRRTVTTAFVPRVGYLLGMRRPGGGSLAGMKVELRGKRAADVDFDYALGGNSLTQRLVEFVNGTVGCFWLLDDGLEGIVGHELKLFNDVDGSTALDPSEVFDVGEHGVMPAVEVPIRSQFKLFPIDPTVKRRTGGSQLDRVRRDPYRQLQCEFALAQDSEVFREGLANDMDWQRLEYALLTGEPCVVMPRWTNAGVFDADTLHRFALFGEMSSSDGVHHRAGPWWQSRAEFDEIPA